MGLFGIFGKKKDNKKEEEVEKAVEEEKPAIEPTKEEAPVEEEKPEEVKVEKEEPIQPEPVEEVKIEEKVEEPVKEEAPKQEEPKEEEASDEGDDIAPVFVIGENGEKIYPGRTFMDRLIVASPELKQMYSDLKNVFLSYKKVHTRVSKTNDAFRFEGNLIGKIIVAGNYLKIYLALDPESVDSAIYHQKDASGKKHFKETPLVIRVKSPLSYRKAKVLIAMACEKQSVKKERFKPKDWTNPSTKDDEE